MQRVVRNAKKKNANGKPGHIGRGREGCFNDELRPQTTKIHRHSNAKNDAQNSKGVPNLNVPAMVNRRNQIGIIHIMNRENTQKEPQRLH